MLSDTTLDCIYTNTLQVSVHHNHHQAHLLQNFKNEVHFAICNFSFSEISLICDYWTPII